MRLRCVVSSPGAVRSSPMLVGNNKVVEDEVRWRRSKDVVMNSFFICLAIQNMPITSGSPFYSSFGGISYFPEHYRF